MPLQLYNTLTRRREPFEPLEPGRVRVYACGPTVYQLPHIGNYRAFLFNDLLHRYLGWKGYRVQFVMNITDVDDKTIDGALRQGVLLDAFTEPVIDAFFQEMDRLGTRRAEVLFPRATRNIDAMIDLVRRLLERGHAYSVDGSVYYDISSFSGYGKLSRIELDQVRQGERVAADEYGKDDVRDFALWKAAREPDRQVGAIWPAPWGEGRPGWHLECSAMSMAELGESFDIHTGGEDLVFPHHEDEIAQSEGATGKPFVRYWLHVKHLLVGGEKMAKSRGNVFTLPDLLERGHTPAAIRYLLLSGHYRRELNFTLNGLEDARVAIRRVLDFRERLEAVAVGNGEGAAAGGEAVEANGQRPGASDSPGAIGDAAPGAGDAGAAGGEAVEADGQRPGAGDSPGAETSLRRLAETALADFEAGLDDDLNVPAGLAALFTFIREANAALDRRAGMPLPVADRDAALQALDRMDQVLGVIQLVRAGAGATDPELVAWVQDRLDERERARAARDFARADAIREELTARGIAVEDTPQGTRWKRVS